MFMYLQHGRPFAGHRFEYFPLVFLHVSFSVTVTRLRSDCQVWSTVNNCACPSHFSIASVCRDLGHIERALSSGNEALSIYRAEGHVHGRCNMASLLGDLYMAAGDLKMAQRHIQGSMDLCHQLGNAQMQAFNYVSLGNLYARQDGDKRRAMAEWIAALRLFKQLGMELQSQAVIRAMAA